MILHHEILAGDLVCCRLDVGRGPVVPVDEWRYGVAQRLLVPEGDDPVGWHGGWPAYKTREEAVASRQWYEGGYLRPRTSPKYEFRVVVYPPEVEILSPRMVAA